MYDRLTLWGRVTHICVSNLTTIGSDNGLSPCWRQAIIWTNAGTNFSEILIKIHTFSFKQMHLKMLSGKWQTFCLGLNVLKHFNVLGPCPLRHSLESCPCMAGDQSMLTLDIQWVGGVASGGRTDATHYVDIHSGKAIMSLYRVSVYHVPYRKILEKWGEGLGKLHVSSPN